MEYIYHKTFVSKLTLNYLELLESANVYFRIAAYIINALTCIVHDKVSQIVSV